MEIKLTIEGNNRGLFIGSGVLTVALFIKRYILLRKNLATILLYKFQVTDDILVKVREKFVHFIRSPEQRNFFQ